MFSSVSPWTTISLSLSKNSSPSLGESIISSGAWLSKTTVYFWEKALSLAASSTALALISFSPLFKEMLAKTKEPSLATTASFIVSLFRTSFIVVPSWPKPETLIWLLLVASVRELRIGVGGARVSEISGVCFEDLISPKKTASLIKAGMPKIIKTIIRTIVKKLKRNACFKLCFSSTLLSLDFVLYFLSSLLPY